MTQTYIETDLGRATHSYWYDGETYLRRPIGGGGPTEQWKDNEWQRVQTVQRTYREAA